ncbi:MAG: hypothetical protein DCC49_02500 [Acidobacteria bacterium]|nr:MAG: hypothetical protein DCC49_02500 [Acidobacteriota bacterium]
MISRSKLTPEVIHRVQVGSCRAVFTGRSGGASQGAYAEANLADHVGDDPAAVAANRVGLSQELGIDTEWSVVSQVHGARVVDGAPGNCGEADAITLTRPALPAAIFTADCVPVLIISETKLAVVHAGWRGLEAGVIEAAVEALGDAAASAVLGPAISTCCYGVSDELAERFGNRFGTGVIGPGPVLDLHGVAVEVLSNTCGIRSVTALGPCTHSPELFSYRRDGPVTGRQALVGWIVK